MIAGTRHKLQIRYVGGDFEALAAEVVIAENNGPPARRHVDRGHTVVPVLNRSVFDFMSGAGGKVCSSQPVNINVTAMKAVTRLNMRRF